MPLYGYKRDGLTTVVGAALSRAELDDFYNQANELYSEKVMTDKMMHLMDPELEHFQATIAIFTHSTNEEQDQFIAKYEILIGSKQRAIDRNTDMLNYDAPDPYSMDETRTIAELYGLDKHDRWDKRTDAEKEYDEEIKKRMKQLQKEGQISNDDSFAPKKKEGEVHVTDIRQTIDSAGNVEIDNVLAVKVEEGEKDDVPKYPKQD